MVIGQALHADGPPVAQARIEALHHNLRSEIPLGQTITDPQGMFRIDYDAPNGIANIDLVVRVMDGGGDKELGRSEVVCRASRLQRLDVLVGGTVYRSPSEFDRITAVVEPYLDGAPLSSLTNEEVELLADKSRQDSLLIAYLVVAARYKQRTNVDEAAFYGLLRRGLPIGLTQLLSLQSPVQRKALLAAVEANLIPATVKTRIDQILQALKQAAVNIALGTPGTQQTTSLGPLLTAGGLSSTQQNTVLSRYALFEGPMPEFWSSLKKDPTLGPNVVSDLQFTLQLGTLSGGYLPLATEIKASKASLGVNSVGDLVKLQEQDWLALLDKTGVPENTPGNTIEEQAKNYAATLQSRLEAAFPTKAIVVGLQNAQQEENADLIQFFNNNPGFSLTNNVNRYLSGGDTILTGIKDVPVLTDRLKSMQRLYRLIPEQGRFETITALSDAGLNSAQSITRMGKDLFLKSLGPSVGGSSIAESIYNSAEQTAALALNLFGTFSAALNTVKPNVIGSGTPADSNGSGPTWQSLFGSLSFCECEECRSVHSPAAYLVDLLQFLRQQPAVRINANGTTTTPTVTDADGTVRDKTALDVLFERRADIGEIELSCDNTNIELPYIDLALEAVENIVARQEGFYQTTWSTEELLANSEHFNEAAYDRLLAPVHPRVLPFNLWIEEARTYLQHLGVSFDELMTVVRRKGLLSAAQVPLDESTAMEQLKLSPQQGGIVIGATTAHEPWRYWGVSKTNWPASLSALPVFLSQAEISYEALVELLTTQFINRDRKISIRFAELCKIEGATIQNLTEPALDKIHRFLRLQEATGWSTLDLDGAILAMKATDVTPVFIIQVAQICRLNQDLDVPVIELLSWWSNISTATTGEDAEQTSLYDDLFLNNTVLSPVDPAFELNSNRTDLINAGTETFAAHMSTILSALAITEPEYSQLLAFENIQSGDGLNLEKLSRLHRNVSLARALDFSIDDFLSLRTLTDINPFVSPKTCADFVAHTSVIDESDFSIADLNYVLRNVYDDVSSIAPTDSAITLVLDGISQALQAIAAENTFVSDPIGEFTQNRLSLLLTTENVLTAMGILGKTSIQSQGDQATFIQENFAAFMDPVAAEQKLVGNNSIEDLQARYEYILNPLLSYLQRTLSTQHVVQAIAEALGLETATSEALLTQYVSTPLDVHRKSITPFLEIPLNPDSYSDDVMNSYRLLHKVGLVLNRFEAGSDELAWLFEKGPGLGWLDLSRLPVTAIIDSRQIAAMFAGWERLADLYELRDKYEIGDSSIFDVLDLVHQGEAREVVLDKISSIRGWDTADLDFLTGPAAFALNYPGDFADERSLVRLEEAVDLLNRLGLSAAAVAEWRIDTNVTAMREISRDIKNTVKAKYDNDTWLSVAEPLKNSLRERQRNALVAHLIATDPNIEDSTGLYERFLIDVDMSACMKTSRISLALSSVQLFVQRCLMNLESDVEISESAAKQWEWMKTYRVWEANRKIFLFPENWIVSELRDDKSEFFVELENDLLQNEVTDENVETALVNYLQKLDEVANLEVCAVYHEKDADTDVLHVVARTHNLPHVYYYRTRADSSYWTAWEKITLDITGDHLLATVWNRRLYLIWPLFKDATVDTEVSVSAGPPKSLNELFFDEFKIAWNGYLDWDLIEGVIGELEVQMEAQLEEPGFDFIELAEGIWELGAFDSVFDDRDVNDFTDIVNEWVDARLDPEDTVSTETGPGLEIQLAWSERKDGAWTAKSVSEEVLTTTYIAKKSFIFKSDLSGFGVSNATAKTIAGPVGGPISGPSTVTFNVGDLIVSCYRSRTDLKRSLGTFRFTGCNGRVFVTKFDDAPSSAPHILPTSTVPEYMRFVEEDGVDVPLELASGSMGSLTTVENVDYITTLNKTPGQFSLVVPHQYDEFVTQDDFFYQDETCVFHVSPDDRMVLDSVNGYLQDVDLVTFDLASQNFGLVTSMEHSLNNGGLIGGRVGSSPHRSLTKTTVSFELAGTQTATTAALDHSSVADIADSLSGSGVQIGSYETAGTRKMYPFNSFYHPYVCTFLEKLNSSGIEGVMTRSCQTMSREFFDSTYDPVSNVVPQPYPLNDVNFDFGSAFAGYNWEFFFHAPVLIATRLSQNQQFEEAQRWFHFVFNPTLRTDSTGATGAERYWVFLPFYLNTAPQSIDDLLLALNEGDAELEAQVEQWRINPFNPHLIARLRPVAYQKYVVMKYIDNLIAWGDSLFGQDTMESINTATQLYVLALSILGPRPETLLPISAEDNETYNSLADRLDTFSNALVEIENQVPAPKVAPAKGSNPPLPTLNTFYFSIPTNEQLSTYWTTVEDRLFKIRNCMNIEGVVRELPLFQPPIDPALLVRATAAGVDLDSVLTDLYTALPPYRFQVMLQKAVEFCGEVRALGSALLSALEKQDAEELAMLRATHETQLLESVRAVKSQQIEEATKSLEALQKNITTVENRKQYYLDLVSEGLSDYESSQLTLLEDANRITKNAQREETAANLAYLVPQMVVAVPPKVESQYGGLNLGMAAQAIARWHGTYAIQKNYEANRSSIDGGYDRRKREWEFQRDSADLELTQLQTQVAAAEIRVAIAEQDLANHDKQTENTKAVQDLMSTKYTNKDLYSWMVSQASSLYFQSYQLAYDLAKRVQKSYEHETGVTGASFIQFGYWDSLKKGLFAAEKLTHDLHRMEAAFLETGRELEITKHVPLSQLDPEALLRLRETGECEFHIPEAWYNLDYPAHYFRRLKAVRLTIPCVVGPYANVSATLRLNQSWIRKSADIAVAPEPVFTVIPQDAIATSSANQDTGTFEFNFSDSRYLPFEGAGAVSSWHLELPSAVRFFDYDTIADVIVHVSYTARDGGEIFKQAVNGEIESALNDLNLLLNESGSTLERLFSLRQEFASDWKRFLVPPAEGQQQQITLKLSKQLFPRYLDSIWKETNGTGPENEPIKLRVTSVQVFLNPVDATPPQEQIQINGVDSTVGTIPGLVFFDSVPGISDTDIENGAVVELPLTVTEGEVTADTWKDLYVLVRYQVRT
jgi:hypothetical protein